VVKVSGILSISIISASIISVSDEPLELTQPSFKFSNISPEKIKGARDIRLRNRTYINPQSSLLDNCNNETLKDIKNLQKIFKPVAW
jgi:hypothetical protein